MLFLSYRYVRCWAASNDVVQCVSRNLETGWGWGRNNIRCRRHLMSHVHAEGEGALLPGQGGMLPMKILKSRALFLQSETYSVQ